MCTWFPPHRVFLLLAVVLLAGDLSAPSVRAEVDVLSDNYYEDRQGASIDDALEPFNRAMFTVNDELYTWFVRPVTTVYDAVVPADLRSCANNFFHNLEEPLRVVNALLQGRADDAGRAGLRFVVNSIFGVYGLGDPAAREFGLAPVNASLDQTLSLWGLGYGSYLFLPVWGPGTLRSLGSTSIEAYGTPYLMWTDDIIVQAGIYSGKEFNALSLRLDEYDELRRLTLDPYLAVRSAYAQYNASRLHRSGGASVPSEDKQ
ncbi:MAG: hypothetical protein BWK76_22430 [Desulfobulbaceae bacterium A2]|nr:MAG: hypothetical protein BWK76_22430 [Desulfobulbaceae bacterium A2]